MRTDFAQGCNVHWIFYLVNLNQQGLNWPFLSPGPVGQLLRTHG